MTSANGASGFLRSNGLSLAMFGLFVLSAAGQITAGFRVRNEELAELGARALSLGEYLRSGAFAEAVFENWESEFLQMAVFVLLTKGLRQRGSSESKQLTGADDVDQDPRVARKKPDVPWPVKRGGWILKLYERSLSLALIALFVACFVAHAVGGAHAYSEEQRLHGHPGVDVIGYLGTSRFWFESFQNWQSEFLSIGVLIYLSIYLRERGSSQSKPVAAPHAQTGE
jgi:hypothetical protein